MELKRIGTILLAIVLTTAFALTYVRLKVKSVNLGYGLKTKEQELERLLDENETLKFNLNALESSEYLEKVLAGHSQVVKTQADFQVVKVKNGTE